MSFDQVEAFTVLMGNLMIVHNLLYSRVVSTLLLNAFDCAYECHVHVSVMCMQVPCAYECHVHVSVM